jgi:hypothetical protein
MAVAEERKLSANATIAGSLDNGAHQEHILIRLNLVVIQNAIMYAT